jgi:hypothetical protein
MPIQTCTTAQLLCTFGTTPSIFQVLPLHRVQTEYQFAANIMDHVPMVNILPFGMCTSIANPAVASATAAALGVLTPMPCVPVTPNPWIAGAPTVILDKFPALDNISKLMCNWLGVISFQTPGETTDMIP